MRGRIVRVVSALAAIAALGVLVNVGTLAADNNDNDNNGGQHRPPQTLPQGFETHRELLHDAIRSDEAPENSAWILESTRFMGVPFRSFMPDRGDKPTVDLPVNVGIIKGPDGKLGLYDSGWKQLHYIFDLNTSCCWAPIRQQMTAIGLNPNDVEWIVIGHGHWDHAGQISEFPNAILYVQKEELKQIDFFLNYPSTFDGGHISRVNTDPGGCARSPVCGYPPQTVNEILGKVLGGKAHIVDGRHEIRRGVIIHPAFRGHTYASQLLQVNTPRGQLVFGSDTYSSWEGIRDWNVANIQQTDTIQQMLAYEKCYVLTSRPGDMSFHNCVSAHEPISYTAGYPLTSNWWLIPGGREGITGGVRDWLVSRHAVVEAHVSRPRRQHVALLVGEHLLDGVRLLDVRDVPVPNAFPGRVRVAAEHQLAAGRVHLQQLRAVG